MILGAKRLKVKTEVKRLRWKYLWGETPVNPWCRGGLVETKVLFILLHRGVQLILTYSCARPAILVADKGRGGMLLFLLFSHFHSFSSFSPVPLFHLLYYLFYLCSPFPKETTQNDPQGLTCLETPTKSISQNPVVQW